MAPIDKKDKSVVRMAMSGVWRGSGLLPQAMVPGWVRSRPVVLGVLVVVLAAVWFGMFSASYFVMDDGDVADRVKGGLGFPLALLQTLPLLIAFRAPLTAWRLAVVGMFLPIFLVPMTWDWVWAPGACIVYVVISFLVAIAYDRQITMTVGAISSAILVLGGVVHRTEGILIILGIGMVTIPLVLGDLIRVSRTAERKLAVSEQERRSEATLRAVLEERARIARELHDIVAHHMSVIAVQAEAAPYRINGLPEPARETFQTIRGAAKEALTETRRVVGLLRDGEERADRDPAPDLDKIEELITSSREMGMFVNLTVRGNPVPLPGGVGLSIYRIAQESLSNARRHAPGAPVELSLNYTDEAVELRTVNGPGSRGDEVDDREPGHGLVGMRERVIVLGGELEAAPADNGGFVVRARIPV